MPPKKKSKVHHSGSEPDTPDLPRGPQAGGQSHSAAGTKKGEPEKEVEEDGHGPEEDTEGSTSTDESDAAHEDDSGTGPNADLDSESSTFEDPVIPKSPEPESGPCTCRCGGCCCHGTSTDPQHCVRCHADYTFNHSQACTVPHVYASDDRWENDELVSDVTVRSLCCGGYVSGVDVVKRGWDHPAPCFMGWHTTDVVAVEEQYNGLNVLRCDLGPEGKCRRSRMKHHAHYEHLYDEEVKYVKKDTKDQKNYLKRKKGEIGAAFFESEFGHLEYNSKLAPKKRARRDRF